MNFLAHGWLARGGNNDFLYGNLIADGVKGSNLSDWPDDVALGIRHHRRVDAVVDSHPVVRAALSRSPRAGRRYAGIALDMLWDHFISRDHADSLLIQRCYAVLQERSAPERLEQMVPLMIQQDWLGQYADFDFTCGAVKGIGRRLSGPNRLAELIPWLKEDYARLEQDFARMWPDLKRQLSI